MLLTQLEVKFLKSVDTAIIIIIIIITQNDLILNSTPENRL